MSRSLAKRFIPPVAWTLFLLVLLSFPGGYLPSADGLAFDKVVHVVLFFVLAVLWLRAFEAPGGTAVVVVLVCGVLFAPLTEFYQGILGAGRSPDMLDSVADIVGFALGTLVWFFLGRTNLGEDEDETIRTR
jgi:VanZ family protein